MLKTTSMLIGDDTILCQYFEEILRLLPSESLEKFKMMKPFLSKNDQKDISSVNQEKLVQINKELKKILSEKERSRHRFNMLLNEAVLLEDIVNSHNSTQRKVISSQIRQRNGKFVRTREIVEWLWLTRIKPMICRIIGILFMFMSILIVLGECTLFTAQPIGLFPLMVQDSHGVYYTQLYCLIPLLYIILCSYFALFNLKLSGSYGLYSHNHTDPSNLVWSAFFLARLTAPLAYNFFTFLKIKNTVFNEVMGIIDIVPVLGQDFAIFFPLLLIIFCLMNYFNVNGRVMSAFGLTQLSINDEYVLDKMMEGQLAIQKIRVVKERESGLTSFMITNEMTRIESSEKSRYERV